MKAISSTFVLLATFIILDSAVVFGADSQTQSLGPMQNLKLMNVQYTHSYRPFIEWKDPVQLRLLNLYSGFREGISKETPGYENLKIGSGSDIIVFIGQSRILIPRAAETLNFDRMPELNAIRQLHEGLAQVEHLDTAKIETYRREKLFSYRNPPNSRWCSEGLCLKLNLIFDLEHAAMITGFFCIKEPETCRKSFSESSRSWSECLQNPVSCLDGIQAQSELKVSSHREGSQDSIDLRKLTGIDSPVRGTIVENVFWFNHILEFGKYLVVVQPNPHAKEQSVVSAFAVFAFDRKWWERSIGMVDMKDVFLGKSMMNGSEGVAQGLPIVLQKFTQSIGKALLNQ